MGNKGKRRRTQRTPVTAQLVPGRDDDLIAWLTGIESGNRSAAVKRALRAGLGLEQKNGGQPADVVTRADLDDILKDLQTWTGEVTDHLRAEMLKMVRELIGRQGVTTSPQLEDPTQISEDRRNKRDKRIKSAQW